MKLCPLSIGTMHFVGIGGIGMSGLAQILHSLGQKVQGSDLTENANVERLRSLGIPVHVGHHKDNIGDARIVAISTDVPETNPEVCEALRRGLPVVRRSEVLSQIMRLKWAIAVTGTHGKTTTTSLVASILDAASLDPTVINGGIVHDYGTNVRLGTGDWMVAEADESDGTFLRIPSTIAIVTNIDQEHMAYYGTFDNLRQSFRQFIQNVPFYGFAVVCYDDPEVRALVETVHNREIITYGFSPQADIQAINLKSGMEGISFDVALHKDIGHGKRGDTHKNLFLPMKGVHNVLNSLSGIVTALKLDISWQDIAKGLNTFGGVKRRFTETGMVDGILLVDDYAHHPVEIKAVIKAAKDICQGRVIAVMQPHRYSRLASLFGDFCLCFGGADELIITPIYAAGEAPIMGASRDALVQGVREAQPHTPVHTVDTLDETADVLNRIAQPNDIVLFLGAGSITQWANAMPAVLSARRGTGSLCAEQ